MSIKLLNQSKSLYSFVYSSFVSNGNFVNTTGWTATNSVIGASDNVLKDTGNGANATARAYQQTSVPNAAGHEIYVCAKAWVTNAVANYLSLSISDAAGVGLTNGVSTINTPASGQAYVLSLVATCQAGLTGNYRVYINHNYASAATANGKVLQVQEVLAVDITALFGAGNEPSAADCANIFKFVDGTKQPNFSKSFVA